MPESSTDLHPVWEKLLLSFLLACTAPYLASALRDNEVKNHTEVTMGKSGVVCTKSGRRCVYEATCKDRRCRCPEGKEGQAEIECVNKGEYLCHVAGDPHVVGFGHPEGVVSLPCRFRAARFLTKNLNATTEHGTCSFEVYCTNQLIHGRYVVRSVHISVGITDPNQQTHTAIEVFKTYNVSDNGIYSYLTRTTHRDSIWGSPQDELEGVTIYPSFDEVNNFATFEVPHCGVRIKYRAYDRSRAKHQPQLPGVTIQAPQHAQFIDGSGDYPNAVCGKPTDLKTLYEDRAVQLGLNDANTAIVYDILNNEPEQTDNTKMASRCDEAIRLFKKSKNQVADLNACAFYLTKARVSKCIETNKRFPIDAFNKCLANRQNSQIGCHMLQWAAEKCGSLPEWSGPAVTEYSCTNLEAPTTEPLKPKSFLR